ncbi:MAG: cytochrome c oxidase subunit 3 [Gammaproteobacteria bacterium]|nr:cytochrome c oxidase subunit 3 [Gammaproteobacteria bacterium]
MAHATGKYYVPHGSWWPIIGSVGLFALMLGSANALNGSGGTWPALLGLAIVLFMFYGWFAEVVRESVAGYYSAQVDRSFRQGMIWFIFSEVMFFAAFFGALFYARALSVPWLGGEGVGFFTNLLLWEGFEPTWPTDGPAGVGGDFTAIGPWGLPAINTAILLTSGVTLTIAHHALRDNHRGILIGFLAATWLLGLIFVGLQAYEYVELYQDYNLRLDTGIYGSTFFMLTGFHGFHVTLGAIMLIVVWLRCLRGHFTPKQHFAFEATAWYWHFVDVVWLGLYVFVYWF